MAKKTLEDRRSLDETLSYSGIFKKKLSEIDRSKYPFNEIVDPDGNRLTVEEVLEKYPDYEIFTDYQGKPVTNTTKNTQTASTKTKGTNTNNDNNWRLPSASGNIDSSGRLNYYDAYGNSIGKSPFLGENPVQPSADLFYLAAPTLGIEDYLMGKATQAGSKALAAGLKKANNFRKSMRNVNNAIRFSTGFNIPGTNLSYGIAKTPGTYNRIVQGNSAIEDAINSGLIRAKSGLYYGDADKIWKKHKKLLKENGINSKDELVNRAIREDENKLSLTEESLEDIIESAAPSNLNRRDRLAWIHENSPRGSTNHGETVGFYKEAFYQPPTKFDRVIQGTDNSATFATGSHGSRINQYNKDIPSGNAVVLVKNGTAKKATAPAENFVYYDPITPPIGPINPIYKRKSFAEEIAKRKGRRSLED